MSALSKEGYQNDPDIQAINHKKGLQGGFWWKFCVARVFPGKSAPLQYSTLP